MPEERKISAELRSFSSAKDCFNPETKARKVKIDVSLNSQKFLEQ